MFGGRGPDSYDYTMHPTDIVTELLAGHGTARQLVEAPVETPDAPVRTAPPKTTPSPRPEVPPVQPQHPNPFRRPKIRPGEEPRPKACGAEDEDLFQGMSPKLIGRTTQGCRIPPQRLKGTGGNWRRTQQET
jgi:hypothetical protein